jgi:hypothetical protein
MSYFRQIHTLIWKDEDFLEFSQAEKLLFIYFFSNENTTLSGLYKLPLKVVSFETGISLAAINKALEKFESLKKIYYRNGYVFVTKFQKYNSGGDKVRISIKNEIDNIPDCEIKNIYLAYYSPNIPYTYPIIRREEKSKEENREEEPENPTPQTSESSLWFSTTGMSVYPVKSDHQDIDGILRTIQANHRENTVDYLRGFFQEWTKRGYSKTNIGWLDWAISGDIPTVKEKPGQVGETKKRVKIDGQWVEVGVR